MNLKAIIPAFRTEPSVAEVVLATRRLLPDVLLIDDGSTDNTAEMARIAGAEMLRFPVNRGKGAALRAGFSRAVGSGCPAVVTLDVDGPHDPDEIPKILEC